MKALIFVLAILCSQMMAFTNASAENIFDQVMGQNGVFMNVIYKGRSLSVWKEDRSNSPSRYYVMPLCFLDVPSVKCIKDSFKKDKYLFYFTVKLWDSQIAKVVQKALKQKGANVQLNDISQLPIQKVRYGLKEHHKDLKLDYQWKSFIDSSFKTQFEVYPGNMKLCRKLEKLAKSNPEQFLSLKEPTFQFKLSSSSSEFRHINITGDLLQKSSFIAKLTNKNTYPDGNVFLTSEDANTLAHEVFTSASYDEVVSSNYKSSAQEDTVIKALLKNFGSDKVQAIKLTKENWDSVFWDNIYTRPDIQTSFLNDVMHYDNNKKVFKMNKAKVETFLKKLASAHSDGHSDSFNIGGMFEGFGLEFGFSHGEEQSDASSSEDAQKSQNAISLNKLLQAIKESKSKIEWTGKKFKQKDFELYRVNTKNLNSAFETAFNRVVLSKEESVQTVLIKQELDEEKDWLHIYDEVPTLPTTTTTTTITTPKPHKHKTTKHKTTHVPKTTQRKLCPHDSISDALYNDLVLKGVEPCSYMRGLKTKTTSTTSTTTTTTTTTPPPPPPVHHDSGPNVGKIVLDVAKDITGVNLIEKEINWVKDIFGKR